jgi:hypothetical protein
MSHFLLNNIYIFIILFNFLSINLIITKNKDKNTIKPLKANLVIFAFKSNLVILLFKKIKRKKSRKH